MKILGLIGLRKVAEGWTGCRRMSRKHEEGRKEAEGIPAEGIQERRQSLTRICTYCWFRNFTSYR